MKDDSEGLLLLSSLPGAIVSSSGTGRDVQSLALSIQHFRYRPRCRPSSKVSRRMVLEKPLSCVTCPSHVGFRLLTLARRGSCGFR